MKRTLKIKRETRSVIATVISTVIIVALSIIISISIAYWMGTLSGS